MLQIPPTCCDTRRLSASRVRRLVGYLHLVGIAWIVTAGVTLRAATPPYWVGLDFIDAPVASPPPFINDFEPFPITAASNHFVTQGALAGWTEDAARRAVALAVEDVFRAIDVGQSDRTIRLGLTLGPAPGDLDGQRLNLAFGKPSGFSMAVGETPRPGDYNNPQANGTTVAAAYLDNIDNIGSSFVTFDTAASAINAIAGTAAHEIGHVFGAVHVTTTAADLAPLPIMATATTGLSNASRLTKRRFSASKPVGVSNADLLIQNIGTTWRGDFNLDEAVDETDLNVLVANWGLADRLAIEGDANGDHWVDGADAMTLIENWTGGPLAAASQWQLLRLGETAALESVGQTTWVTAPEPSTLCLVFCLCGGLLLTGRGGVG